MSRAAHGCASLRRAAQGAWDESDPAKRIPNPLLPGLVRFIKAVICAALWMKLSRTYGAGAGAPGTCSSRAVCSAPHCVVGFAAGPVAPLLPACRAVLAELLESRYFQEEVGLAHRLFLLWLVGLAARCKY